MNGQIRVLIIEHDWIIARAVQKTLESAGYLVTDVVTGAAQALASVGRERPDIALLDIALADGGDGIALAGQLSRTSGVAVVYVTAHADRETLARAAVTQPSGYVIKPFQEGQLLSAVAIAAARVRPADAPSAAPLPPSAPTGRAPSEAVPVVVTGKEDRERRVRGVAAALARRAAQTGDATDLTSRELEIVHHLLSNGRVSSIAEELDISPHTVRNHLRSIFRKLGVHSQVELIRALAPHTHA